MLSAAISFFILAFLAQPSLADPVIDPSILKKFKFNTWSGRCSTLETLIDKKLDKFETNKTKHYERYITLKERISEKVNSWEKAGYDVNKLNEDLHTLDDKIKKFASDYATYIDKLANTKKHTCSATETEYKDTLKEARNALKDVRKDVVDIKTFYWTTVRQDILALKEQKISNSGE